MKRLLVLALSSILLVGFAAAGAAEEADRPRPPLLIIAG